MDKEEYLSELIRVHDVIKHLLKDFEPIVRSRKVDDVVSVLQKLRALKAVLLEHVKAEDERFYKELREKAIKLEQEALLPALDFFISSMNEITRNAQNFFSTYGDEESILRDEKNFVAELDSLREEILKRIKSEEGSLFYIYRAYFLN